MPKNNSLYKNRFVSPTRPIGAGKNSGLSIIILDARPGYRMKSHGSQSLIKDRHGVSILEHQVALYKTEYALCEIIVVGGFDIDRLAKIKPDGVRLVENQHFENSGELEDLRLALNNAIYTNVLVTYGDIYFGQTVLKNVTLNDSTLVLDQDGRMLEEDIGSTVVDGEVTALSLALPTPKWSKIAHFANNEVQMLRQYASIRDNGKLFLHEVLTFILDKGGKFKSKFIPPNEVIVHVNSKQLEKI